METSWISRKKRNLENPPYQLWAGKFAIQKWETLMFSAGIERDRSMKWVNIIKCRRHSLNDLLFHLSEFNRIDICSLRNLHSLLLAWKNTFDLPHTNNLPPLQMTVSSLFSKPAVFFLFFLSVKNNYIFTN